MEILSKLFGSTARVKIMRLFLFNPADAFDMDMVAEKSHVDAKTAKRECALLAQAGMIRPKAFFKLTTRMVRGKRVEKRLKAKGYELNGHFSYVAGLKHLLISTKTLEAGEILNRLSKTGKLKLVIIAGIFTREKDSRLDILIVGDNLKKSALASVIKSIEAELGKELLYAYFETKDFQYRLSMYDKLVKDVLDYPHEVLLDRMSQ